MHLQPTMFLFGINDFMLPCLNKRLFGVECPGCGMQRSIQLLFQGEFVAAFKMYPAIYPLTFFFLFLLANNFFKSKYSETIVIILGITSVATILINYIFKLLR